MSEPRSITSEVEVSVDPKAAFTVFTEENLDAHFANAQAKGATIVEEIHHHGYRAYVADDIEGHRWTFAQANPKMV